ncbi:DUF167 domain-containing protein [Chloroflexota bacterium]
MAISGNDVQISLRVYPNASRNEAMGFSGEVLRVKISAPPIKGKANRELITFLSRLLGVGKGSVNVVKGHTTRNKVVVIEGLSREEVVNRFSLKPFSSGDASR